METIDNLNSLLGDSLKQALRPGAKLQVAASCFSMFAYEALKGELEKVDFYISHIRPRSVHRQTPQRASRILHPQTGARAQSLRDRVRDSAPQQAHPTRHRKRMRRLDSPQSHLPLECYQVTHATDGLHRGEGQRVIRLLSSSGLHCCRSRLPEGRSPLKLRDQVFRGDHDSAVPRHLRADMARSGKGRGCHRASHRAHLERLLRELP